jgi:hypothetical protein
MFHRVLFRLKRGALASFSTFGHSHGGPGACSKGRFPAPKTGAVGGSPHALFRNSPFRGSKTHLIVRPASGVYDRRR